MRMRDATRIKLKQWRLFVTLFAALALVPTLYQNCSEAPLESQDLSSVAATAPFAYDEKIDQIAYMSCSELDVGDTNTMYFTFKAGAYYSGSGLRLNDSFIYAARNLVTSDKIAALAQSPANGNVYLSMGVRSLGNLQSLNSIIGRNEHTASFLGALSATPIATPLVSNITNNGGKNYVRTFSATTPELSDIIKLAGNGTVVQNEQVAETIRTLLNNQTDALTLTYNKTNADVSIALGPTQNSAASVYGKGFKMNFIKGTGRVSAFTDNYVGTINQAPVRIMTNVKEFSLLDPNLSEVNWNCNTNWRFIIVKNPAADLGTKIVCDKVNQAPTNAAQTETLTTLRKMLPATDWDIDLTNKCLIPKKTGFKCYTNGTAPVNYDGGSCNREGMTCPHYVSICKKS